MLMAVTYFKRYRMELRLDLLATKFTGSCDLVPGFCMLPWSPQLLNRHAEVKCASFRNEIDAHVFPCLGDLDGCRQLMREISGRKNFVPEATWLICREPGTRESNWGIRDSRGNKTEVVGQACGTVQGLLSSRREGAIQNLGVHPECRDLGLGSVLLQHALEGFRQVGCRYVNLEVTVQNTAAIRLYERFGFQRVETLFKVADVQYA
jgi:ribosomal protein S18 acetylase RimI-like enzyme